MLENKNSALKVPLLSGENTPMEEEKAFQVPSSEFQFSRDIRDTIATMHTDGETEDQNYPVEMTEKSDLQNATNIEIKSGANELSQPSIQTDQPPSTSSKQHHYQLKDIVMALVHIIKRVRLAFRDRLVIIMHVLLWSLIIAPIGAFIGCTCAVFLWGLNKVTQLRFDYPWLLFLLPIAGVFIALTYRTFGRETKSGNNLILDEIYHPRNKTKGRGSIPSRMAPLILFATWATHLFGGSAGREGTAIQMAVSLMSTYARILRATFHIRFEEDDTRTLFIAGIAAGFGGVFGTPIAATIFSVEVLIAGSINLATIGPALIASLTADWFGRLILDLLGSKHTEYDTPCFRLDDCGGHFVYQHDLDFSWVFLLQVIFAGLCYGLAASLFAWGMHHFGKVYKWIIPNPNHAIFHPIIGGIIIIIMRYMFDTVSYLGIGTTQPDNDSSVVTIVTAFDAGGAHLFSWLLKLIFTVVTLTSGFKGGEVTPLFYIGATLGNTMTRLLSVSSDLTNVFAAMGFVSVFGAATNTPLSSFIMGIELFGGDHALYLGTSCIVAYIASASNSIYTSQRLQSDFKIVMRLAEKKLGFIVQRKEGL